MSARKLVSFLGKIALLVAVVSLCMLTETSSASPIAPGFDLFTSNDALGNSLGAAVPFVLLENVYQKNSEILKP